MLSSLRTRAILQALLVTFLWSTSWVLIKLNIHDIPPLTFAALRYSTAVLFLLPGLWKHKIELQKLSGSDWRFLALLGLVFYALTQGGQFLTLKHLPATTFSLLLNFTTVFVAFFGIISLKEIPSRMQWFGIGIFIFGVLVYFCQSIHLAGNTPGFLMAGFTVIANAAAALLGRSINRQKTILPLVVTVISMGIGAISLLASGFIFEEFPSLSLANLAVILWLAIVNTAFAFTLWNKSLQALSAVESSIINNSMLIQIAILAWIFLGEALNLYQILGLILASAGIFLTNRKRKNNS